MIDIVRRYQALPTVEEKRLAWLFGALVIITYIPVIHYLIGPYVAMLITLACYYFALFSSHEAFHRVRWLLITVIIFMLLSAAASPTLPALGMKDTVLWFYEFLGFALPLFIVSYLLVTARYQLLALLSLLALITIIITAITTFVGLDTFPEAARRMATGDNGDGNVYLKHNIGDFTFVYSLVLALPVYIYLIRQRLYNLLIGVSFLIFSFFLVVKMQYAMAVLLWFVTPAIAVMRQVSWRAIVVIVVLFVCGTFLIQPVLPDILDDAIAATAKTPALQDRFTDIAGMLEPGTYSSTSDMQDRNVVYSASLNLFLKNPLVGNLWSSYKMYGGHSTILDTLATTGLIGGLLLFLILRFYYMRIVLPLRSSVVFGYVIISLLLFLIVSLLNPSTSLGMVLFLIIPGIAFVGRQEAPA